MKIYHTETQADYDALMVELESEGYIWKGTLDKPTQWNGWNLIGKETIVKRNGAFITQGTISDYKSIYEQTPITKYKAKADEKMRFTKENVETPIKERRDEKEYQLKNKLEIKGMYSYLVYYTKNKYLDYGLGGESSQAIKTSFTAQEWELLTEQTWEDLLLQFKAIET